MGLVNIGVEEEKGNELTKATYPLLKEDKTLNFIGNFEPREIPSGNCQILVCDGFVGNTILKMYEGTVSTLLEMIKESLMSTTKGKIGGLLVKDSLKSMMKKYDYKETGGSPFPGIDGIAIKAHGSSDATAGRLKNRILPS